MKKQMLVTLLFLLNAAISTSVVQAAVRVTVPDEWPGIPAYTRTDVPLFQTDEWAAVVFYREPECVPGSFNLLEFFDIPAVFECPLTVAGFEIWENGPPPSSSDQAPIFYNYHGLGAVPVWFVSWPDLQQEIADGVLTIADLASMASLQIGLASFYDETLHPLDPGGLGGAQHVSQNIIAHGRLLDGRSFQFAASADLHEHGPNAGIRVRSIKISFR